MLTLFLLIKSQQQQKNYKDSENADSFTSVTYDVWSWPYTKVDEIYVIRCPF